MFSRALARPMTRPSFSTATSTFCPCAATASRRPPARAAASRVISSARRVRLAWFAASCCSIRFSTRRPIFGSAGATPWAAAACRASSTMRGMSMTMTCEPGGGPRRPSPPGPPPRRGAEGGIGTGTLSGDGPAGPGSPGAGWNSTRSTSAAVSPNSDPSRSRRAWGSGLNGCCGEPVPARNRRSIRRPTSAVTISIRRLTSVALSVASRRAACSKARTDDVYESKVTAESGSTERSRKAMMSRVLRDISTRGRQPTSPSMQSNVDGAGRAADTEGDRP